MGRNGVPSLYQHGGYAVVTLRDSLTRERRDFYCGDWGDPAANRRYNQVLGEWLANNRRLRPLVDDCAVAELVHQWWQPEAWARGERSCQEAVKGLLLKLHAATPVSAFGPIALRAVRQVMVDRGWSRRYANRQTQRIIAVFRWGESHELCPAGKAASLRELEPLREGDAPDAEPVRPVADAVVEATLPHLPPVIADAVRLQRLTGARGDELLRLRQVDIGPDWTARLTRHKTASRGKRRTIIFGPRARGILARLLSPTTDPDRHIFAYAGLRRESRVTPAVYRRAIARACEAAFPPPLGLARRRVPARGRKAGSERWETIREWQARLGPDRWAELQAWRDDHHWHPHQLRHTAATGIAAEHGLVAAQLVLGHASARVTDAVYAERDLTEQRRIMEEMG